VLTVDCSVIHLHEPNQHIAPPNAHGVTQLHRRRCCHTQSVQGRHTDTPFVAADIDEPHNNGRVTHSPVTSLPQSGSLRVSSPLGDSEALRRARLQQLLARDVVRTVDDGDECSLEVRAWSAQLASFSPPFSPSMQRKRLVRLVQLAAEHGSARTPDS
jgi:hypothetical protein